jgi:16S rRNA (cytosine1402-N4)-methyltransferase
MIGFLDVQDGKTYVDATFGGGGYSEKILSSANCCVVAIDCDSDAKKRAESFCSKYEGRFRFIPSNFCHIEDILETVDFHGIVFDFGVSSFQLETPARGFSFQFDGPLDMRMNESGISALDVVNTFSRLELAEIIRTYGEESFAWKISSVIVEARKIGQIKTTLELASIVRKVVPRNKKIDPATKTFQAIRIFVNDELRNIERALRGISSLVIKKKLKDISVVAVTFHSLEDKVVKNWLNGVGVAKENAGDGGVFIEKKTAKVVTPSEKEIKINPRSRSAKLRAALISFNDKIVRV